MGPGLEVSQTCGDLQQHSEKSRYEQGEGWWGELDTENSSLDHCMRFGVEGRDYVQMSQQTPCQAVLAPM